LPHVPVLASSCAYVRSVVKVPPPEMSIEPPGRSLVGHVGSALLNYAIIGIAILLGSSAAEAAADDPDFGISCVLGASLGALFASGYRLIGAVSFVLLLPFSLDWYGPEHPLSFALGALVVARCGRRPRLRRGRHAVGGPARREGLDAADQPSLR